MKPSAHILHIGDPMDRVDGIAKVTGAARYAAENNLKNICHGVLVTSTIARGKIKTIDTRPAEHVDGVIAVITHKNAPNVPGYADNPGPQSRVQGQEFRVFYNDEILYSNQPVALVIAETFEKANEAAALVSIQYISSQHNTDLDANLSKAVKPERSEDHEHGTADAYKNADVSIEQEYRTAIQVHNTLEPHAATAVWDAPEQVTVYNKTQAVKIAQKDIMRAFRLKEDQVTVHSPFVGGAFGSSSRVWPQEMAAIIGAKAVGRPVKVALRRDQVFNMVGYRPRSIQKFGIGATRDGKLTGITHEATGISSSYEQFTERIVDPSKTLYACPNINTRYKLVQLDVSTPCWTRGPGETSGSFALESAMDELAHALKIDPVELRLRNYAERDPSSNLPWSSKFLKECYQTGAKHIGWEKRKSTPAATRNGSWYTGLGMSSGIYHAKRDTAEARARLTADGQLTIECATADVGPGTATVMTQIAADASGLDPKQIRFLLGDSAFPKAPGQFGSQTTASVGSAVHDVCLALKERLVELAVNKQGSSLYEAKSEELVFQRDHILRRGHGTQMSFADILHGNSLAQLVVTKESRGGPEIEKFSSHAYCANFVEVQVNAWTGTVKVSRIVSVVDAGRIMNHKTARSQVIGSMVWGIGIALMEEGLIDHRYGRYINNNLADYHVPVNADVPDIDVTFIDQRDPILNPMGAKGIGEIPLIGFSAAVANAIYNACGARIRELPITPDKILAKLP